MSDGGLSKERLGRMHDVMAGHVADGRVPGLVSLVSRRGEVHAEAEVLSPPGIFRLEPGTGRILRVFEGWGDVRGIAWDGDRLWWVECGDRRAYPVGEALGVGR